MRIIDRRHEQAQALFDALRTGSLDHVRGGVTRDTYGAGEAYAHALLAKYATEIGLEVKQDFMCNTYMVLPGLDRSLPAIVIGSHLDSVAGGGNFDGAAGVVSGLIAVQALKEAGIQLPCDVVVMGVRAEESIWFQVSYIGSRGALGRLQPEALDARRIDTQRSLADHLAEAGGDPEAVKRGDAYLSTKNVRAFMEVHIEQAPSLALTGFPIAIGTGVPGNFRYPKIRIKGEYGHVGLGRRFRHDASLAGADLTLGLDAMWAEWERQGRLMACTVGEFHTNAERHGLTVVPGEFSMSLDVRAYVQPDLMELESAFLALVKEVEKKRGVTIDLGPRASAEVAQADPELTQQLRDCARALSLPHCDLPSPASHDAAAFCAAGIPFGFLFIRNPNGSHHPEEAMATEDFMLATEVLTQWLVNQCQN
ncbi:Zn-dependent hydrolase [Zwartia sp.]|uniref:Zn-dependent hydrolase n=1 Tax=Zwartia sp. TaxID=2978004 RepID=UPI003BB1B45E